MPEHKVVAVALDAETVEGDARLLERKLADMADKGWLFESIATPKQTYALVVFRRRPEPEPPKKKPPRRRDD